MFENSIEQSNAVVERYIDDQAQPGGEQEWQMIEEEWNQIAESLDQKLPAVIESTVGSSGAQTLTGSSILLSKGSFDALGENNREEFVQSIASPVRNVLDCPQPDGAERQVGAGIVKYMGDKDLKDKVQQVLTENFKSD